MKIIKQINVSCCLMVYLRKGVFLMPMANDMGGIDVILIKSLVYKQL